MKKTSTPTVGHPTKRAASQSKVTPREATISFLKQFARTYCPATHPALPGYVLN